MKELFQAIQDRLIAEVPEIKFVDFDLGQLEQEPLPSLSYPSALISFGESPFSDLGGLNQEAEVMVNIRFAFRTFERTHSVNNDADRLTGLQHMDILDKAKWKLHGHEGDSFTALSHRSFTTEPRADLRVYSLTFETLLSVSPPNPQYVPANTLTDPNTDQPLSPSICIADANGNEFE